MTNSIELIKERFALLPEDAQKAIQQFEYDKALKEIFHIYKLHIDQAYSLEKAVASIIFGDLKANQRVSFLQNEIRVSTEVATNLNADINKKILLPIQENMRAIEEQF